MTKWLLGIIWISATLAPLWASFDQSADDRRILIALISFCGFAILQRLDDMEARKTD